MKIISYGSIYVFVPQNGDDVNHLVAEVQRQGGAGTFLGGNQGKFLDLVAEQPQLIAAPAGLYEFAGSPSSSSAGCCNPPSRLTHERIQEIIKAAVPIDA